MNRLCWQGNWWLGIFLISYRVLFLCFNMYAGYKERYMFRMCVFIRCMPDMIFSFLQSYVNIKIGRIIRYCCLLFLDNFTTCLENWCNSASIWWNFLVLLSKFFSDRIPVRLYVWSVTEDFDDLEDVPEIDSWDKISYINRPVEIRREEGTIYLLILIALGHN